MKQLLLTISALLFATAVCAEGYQVNTLSAKQLGMGHVGTGMKLNSESIYFNPAGTAFQTSRFSFSVGITGIKSNATYLSNNDYRGNPQIQAHSDNKISTPLYAYFNYKATKNLAVGLGFYTPYGSSMNWGDNWVGAHLIQSIDLQAYTLQPTISYKFWDKLSVGVGMTITWGTFDLSRSMFPVGEATNNTIAGLLTAAGQGQYAELFTQAGDRSLVSARIKGDAKTAIGVNVGILWDITPEWTLGFSYRSKVKMKVASGTANLLYASPEIGQVLQATGMIPDLSSACVETELPLPANLAWGVGFRPTPKWEMAFDIQYVLWSAYKSLHVDITDPTTGASVYDLPTSIKNYKNTVATRIGVQYHACKFVTARLGMYVDESPVRSDFLNPETPSMTKVSYTAGVTINPCKNVSIDLAYGYITSADPERTGSCDYYNSLTYKAVYAQTYGQAHRRRNGPGASENPGSYHGKRQGDPAFFGQLFPVGAHFRYRSEPEILKPPRFPVKITIFAVRTFPVRTVSVYRDLRHDTRFPIESQRFLPAETTSGRSRTALQGSIVQGIERKFPKLQIRVRVAVELLSSLQDDLPGRPVCILLPI